MEIQKSSWLLSPFEMESYLFTGLLVRYVIYLACVIVLLFFPSMGKYLGAKYPFTHIFLAILILTGWIPFILRKTKFLPVSVYISLSLDYMALVHLTFFSGGARSPVTVTFPVITLAFGLSFRGVLTYLIPSLAPWISYSGGNLIKGFSTLPDIITSFWLTLMNVVVLYIVIYYRKKLDEQKTYLESLAGEDELTGLLNYRSFWKDISNETARAIRGKRTLSLILIDLDNFKEINDKYGHRFGDYVLSAVGKIIAKNIRKADRAYRYGGDEFAIILAETDEKNAESIARRISNAITNDLSSSDRIPVRIGATYGISNLSFSEKEVHIVPKPEELINHADSALRENKNKKKLRSLNFPFEI